MGKYEIRHTQTGCNFHLMADNNETIGTSEVYKSVSSCKGGIKSVAANAPIAAVEDQTKEGFAKEKHPKFEIYSDKKGEIRFRLKAKNGQNILASEGYKAMDGCQNGIASVRENAGSESVMVEDE